MRIKVTAQERYQKKMVARGLCRICGKRRYGNAYLCPYHAKKAAKYMKSWRAAKKAATPQTPEMPCSSQPTT